MEEGFYYWKTEYYHCNNEFTMIDYIENHLDEGFEILVDDGTRIEVSNGIDRFEINASGNGDSYNHKVEIIKI